MLIPLLGFTVAGIEEEHRSQAARMAMNYASAESSFRARGYELWNACTGPDACALVLLGIDLRVCRIDGVGLGRSMPARIPQDLVVRAGTDPYRGEQNALPPNGLFAICPGLHNLATEVSGNRVELAVTLHPREARAFAFDHGTLTFRELEAEEEARCIPASLGGGAVLFDYNASVAAVRAHHANTQLSRDAQDACEKWLAQALDVIVKGIPAKAFEVAESARSILTGVPMGSFAPLTEFIGFHVFDLQQKGLAREARTLLDVGLVILPDSPTLLAIQGEMLRTADKERGEASIRRALRREASIPPALRERVRALL